MKELFIICEVTPVGFEPTTPRLKVECIYQLSYEVNSAPDRIRTYDSRIKSAVL